MIGEELMIGDVVVFPHGIDKVVDILYVDGKGLCASFAASATLFPIEVERLAPFTMTVNSDVFEDMLTRLGFEHVGGGLFILLDVQGDIVKKIEFHTRNHWLSINDGVISPISSMSEIQHALKLCGLRSRIVL